jgi:hypothetical protein
MDLINKIQYVFHYDELTWMPHLINRPFNEIKIPYMGRERFINWINENVEYHVIIWPGVITPNPMQQNWGHIISPNEHTSFLIFTNDKDQTRFSLEFVGSDNSILIKTYKNGIDAYHSRKK